MGVPETRGTYPDHLQLRARILDFSNTFPDLQWTRQPAPGVGLDIISRSSEVETNIHGDSEPVNQAEPPTLSKGTSSQHTGSRGGWACLAGTSSSTTNVGRSTLCITYWARKNLTYYLCIFPRMAARHVQRPTGHMKLRMAMNATNNKKR